MRAVQGLLAILAVLAIAQGSCHAQDREWQAAAKDLVNYTTELLESKVKEDKQARLDLRNFRDALLTEKEVTRLGKELKAKLKTDEPDKEKIQALKTSIKKQVDKLDEKRIVKDIKAQKDGKVKGLIKGWPWPFGDG